MGDVGHHARRKPWFQGVNPGSCLPAGVSTGKKPGRCRSERDPPDETSRRAVCSVLVSTHLRHAPLRTHAEIGGGDHYSAARTRPDLRLSFSIGHVSPRPYCTVRREHPTSKVHRRAILPQPFLALVEVGMAEDLHLGHHLVREAVRHHEARVTRRAAEVE